MKERKSVLLICQIDKLNTNERDLSYYKSKPKKKKDDARFHRLGEPTGDAMYQTKKEEKHSDVAAEFSGKGREGKDLQNCHCGALASSCEDHSQ